MALHHKVIAAATSSQSHLIVGAVLLAFIVWATLHNSLGYYLAYLGLGKNPVQQSTPQQVANAGAMGGNVGSSIGSLIGQLPPLPGL